MSQAFVLWRRDADPSLPPLPPVFVTGYHLDTDEKYIARTAADDAALVAIVPPDLPEDRDAAAEFVREHVNVIALRLIEARKALAL